MVDARTASRVQRVKQGVREIAYVTGVSSGCTGFLNAADRARRTGLYVFIGHHVLADDPSDSILTAERLQGRLLHLSKHFDMVSVSEALEWLDNPSMGDRLAAITFDDGYRDNLTVGLPVLEATGVPATVFVCTEPVLTGRPLWFDVVRSAAASDAEALMGLPWVREIAEASPAGDYSLADRLVNSLNQIAPGQRMEKVGELTEVLGGRVDDLAPHLQPLSPDELGRLSASPLITIGAHTHTHSVIGCCGESDLRDDLARNISELERLTGERPTVFAYPKGVTDAPPLPLASLLDELRLKAAFTTQRRINRLNSDRWMLGRFPLGAGPVSTFAWELMQLRF